MMKTVLITGSGSGIGYATAQYFAGKGWNVIATMRSPVADIELAKISNLLVTRMDVQDLGSIDQAIQAGIARFGSIDVLINSAGYGQYGLFEAIPREKIQQQFDVNVFGVMDVTRAILPHFRKNKNGVIMNISSGAGIFTLPMISMYCASKFAIEGFSESLAYELASQNIIVKLIEPHGGVTNTRFNERTAQDNAKGDSLVDYGDFAKQTADAFANMSAARTISSNDVAKVIFEAATDDTNRLRYLVGNDTRGFIKAKQDLSDNDYIDFMRSKFRLKS